MVLAVWHTAYFVPCFATYLCGLQPSMSEVWDIDSSQKPYWASPHLQSEHQFVCVVHIILFDFPILTIAHEQLVYHHM